MFNRSKWLHCFYYDTYPLEERESLFCPVHTLGRYQLASAPWMHVEEMDQGSFVTSEEEGTFDSCLMQRFSER
jgi:hypothetical protein